MLISLSLPQLEKVPFSMEVALLPMVTLVRLTQLAKAYILIDITLSGMMTFVRLLHE